MRRQTCDDSFRVRQVFNLEICVKRITAGPRFAFYEAKEVGFFMKNQKQFTHVISIFAGLALLSFFQNCSPVSFEQSDLSKSLGDPIGGTPSVGFRSMSQTVNVTSTSEVDILFVIDNSGSMTQEQTGLSNKIAGFMDIIKDLDWQIALTTTDPRSGKVVKDASNQEREWGDGQFRAFNGNDGNEFILKPSLHTLSEAQSKLSTAITVGIAGSGDERGINAVYRAIERRSSSGPQNQFFRQNSKLVVVLISDEDECSNGNCSQSSSNPQNLLNLVAQRFGSEKVFKFNSIVKAPSDVSCTTAANVANRYDLMSRLSGGVVGSICAQDYTQILTNMGHKVRDLVKSANLSCEPVDSNGDGRLDVVVEMANGQQLTHGFALQGSTITFDQTLPEGLHRISYVCLEVK